jgi:hypothetical protein
MFGAIPIAVAFVSETVTATGVYMLERPRYPDENHSVIAVVFRAHSAKEREHRLFHQIKTCTE